MVGAATVVVAVTVVRVSAAKTRLVWKLVTTVATAETAESEVTAVARAGAVWASRVVPAAAVVMAAPQAMVATVMTTSQMVPMGVAAVQVVRPARVVTAVTASEV
jgi:hypothetical protein